MQVEEQPTATHIFLFFFILSIPNWTDAKTNQCCKHAVLPGYEICSILCIYFDNQLVAWRNENTEKATETQNGRGGGQPDVCV